MNLSEERIEEAFSNELKISIGHHLLIVDHRIKYDATGPSSQALILIVSPSITEMRSEL